MGQKTKSAFGIDSPLPNVAAGEAVRSDAEEELLVCAEYIEGLSIEGEVRIGFIGLVLTEWGINSEKNISRVEEELERMGIYVTRER